MTDPEYDSTWSIAVAGWTWHLIAWCLYLGVFRGPMP